MSSNKGAIGPHRVQWQHWRPSWHCPVQEWGNRILLEQTGMDVRCWPSIQLEGYHWWPSWWHSWRCTKRGLPKNVKRRARQHAKLTDASLVKAACAEKSGWHTGSQYHQGANVCDKCNALCWPAVEREERRRPNWRQGKKDKKLTSWFRAKRPMKRLWKQKPKRLCMFFLSLANWKDIGQEAYSSWLKTVLSAHKLATPGSSITWWLVWLVACNEKLDLLVARSTEKIQEPFELVSSENVSLI